MNAIAALERTALTAVIVVALIYVGVRLVRYGKKRSAGAVALGAVLMLFGLGNVREPENQFLEQAQPPKKREGESGDPPNE